MTSPVSSVTPPTTTTPPAANSAAASQGALTTNFDTFLTLLTTQLKNQDPLSPMDSSQFTQQLVQFSSVEQQIDSNQNLENLIALTKSNSGMNAVSYLGKTITMTDGTGALQNGSADWNYSLGADSAATVLTVTDSTGKTVYAASGATGAGAHDFAWNGQDNSGNTLPDGTYKLNVQAVLPDGTADTSAVISKGQVSEVDLSGAEPMLIIGPMSIPLSSASLISGM